MKKQIHLHPDDLKKSDQMGLTYNLGQAHKRMLLKQSSIMKKYGLTARQALQCHGAIGYTVEYDLHLYLKRAEALRALLDDASCAVEAFLLPGHVSTILGLQPYGFLASEYHVPGVVGGFEPADILLALCLMAEQLRDKAPAVVNAIYNATGVAIDTIPITPHVLYAEFSRAGLIRDSWKEEK